MNILGGCDILKCKPLYKAVTRSFAFLKYLKSQGLKSVSTRLFHRDIEAQRHIELYIESGSSNIKPLHVLHLRGVGGTSSLMNSWLDLGGNFIWPLPQGLQRWKAEIVRGTPLSQGILVLMDRCMIYSLIYNSSRRFVFNVCPTSSVKFIVHLNVSPFMINMSCMKSGRAIIHVKYWIYDLWPYMVTSSEAIYLPPQFR